MTSLTIQLPDDPVKRIENKTGTLKASEIIKLLK